MQNYLQNKKNFKTYLKPDRHYTNNQEYHQKKVACRMAVEVVVSWENQDMQGNGKLVGDMVVQVVE